ncbi:MAG: hypothetical protein EPN22_17460 [Nitrospirae bacterium]|nr:MAG: hypothetical protein EPN22_17460 [Nitrospirota bacterium]
MKSFRRAVMGCFLVLLTYGGAEADSPSIILWNPVGYDAYGFVTGHTYLEFDLDGGSYPLGAWFLSDGVSPPVGVPVATYQGQVSVNLNSYETYYDEGTQRQWTTAYWDLTVQGIIPDVSGLTSHPGGGPYWVLYDPTDMYGFGPVNEPLLGFLVGSSGASLTAGVITSFESFLTNLSVVGATILSLFVLLYGFRVVKKVVR